MIQALETLAAMALASTVAPNEAPNEATLDTPLPTLCKASETTILYGQVEDGFGLDVAVCTSGDEDAKTLTIRWDGEGGGSSVSCAQGNCNGRIEYSRYTSPHLTVLTLAWRDGEHSQWLTQSAGRGDMQEPAKGETRHYWQTPGTRRADAPDYPVKTEAGELSLMTLENILEPKPLHRPLLEAQP